MIATLWAYETIFNVTTQTISFSLVYGLKANLSIEFEVEPLRVAVDFRFTKKKFTALEKLDER